MCVICGEESLVGACSQYGCGANSWGNSIQNPTWISGDSEVPFVISKDQSKMIGSTLWLYNIAMENQYRQLRAGNLEGDSRTPTGVLQSFSQGGALGINFVGLDLWQLVLGGFWNHIMGNQENDPRTPSFWAFLLSKKGIKNCIQGKTTISQAQLSACFLCSHANPLFLFLTPLMNKNRSRLSFPGNFRLVNLIFN